MNILKNWELLKTKFTFSIKYRSKHFTYDFDETVLKCEGMSHKPLPQFTRKITLNQ